MPVHGQSCRRWRGRSVSPLVGLILLSLISLSCNESLPSYAPPATVFEGTLRGVTIQTKVSDYVGVYFTVKNIYHETLQSHGMLSGMLEITFPPVPSFHKTVLLDSSFFVNPQNLNMRTGVVTVDPGDSLAFVFRWDLYDDNGVFLPDLVQLKADPNCPTIRRADPLTLVFNCSFQVFDTYGQVRTESAAYVFAYWFGTLC